MTPSGRGALVAGFFIAVVGIATGYGAVLTAGLTLLVATVLAVLATRFDADLEFTRKLVPNRIVAGTPAKSIISVTNTGRRQFTTGVATERIDGTGISVAIPNLEPDESATIEVDLPTDRRGVYVIGPLTVPRSDPIGLARRGNTATETDQLIVHPRTIPVTPFPARRRRNLEGAPSGEAAAGGITFSNLRPYVPGDDVRLIHWKSTARMDELMVRHNVDVHRPRTCIILDTDPDVYDEETFEQAVSSAASVILAAQQRRFPFQLRTVNGLVLEDPMAIRSMLDQLAGVKATVTEDQDLASTSLDASRTTTGLSCAVITGRSGIQKLQKLGPLRTRFEQFTIVRMGAAASAQVHSLSGATLINSPNAEQFAVAWNRSVLV